MEQFLFQHFSVGLGFCIVVLGMSIATWYGEEDKSFISSKRMGLVLTVTFGVLTFFFWLGSSNAHYTERDRLTRALYDHNITLKGYESINKEYAVEDFRKGL